MDLKIEFIQVQNLKPCPFCGSEAAMQKVTTKVEKVQRFRVKCLECWCRTEWDSFSQDEAEDKWNKRMGYTYNKKK